MRVSKLVLFAIVVTVLLSVLGPASGGAVEEEPFYRFRFDSQACGSVDGVAGAPFSRDLVLTLESGLSPIPDLGATGWSYAISFEGVTVSDFTVVDTAAASVDDDPPGYVSDGFQITGFAAGGAAECTARSTIVSAVTLSASGDAMLPATGLEPVLRLSVEGSIPDRGETTGVEMRFLEGCTIAGVSEPVLTTVAWNGIAASPFRHECNFELRGPSACPISDAPLQVIFQDRNVGSSPRLFHGSTWPPDAPDMAKMTVPPGTRRFWVGIVSQLADYGVQGWTLSIGLEGDATLVDATVDETAADFFEDHPNGLRHRGETSFEVTEIVDPTYDHFETRAPQGQGVVSAVVLSFVAPRTLPPRGTASVLELEIEGGADGEALLRCKDGLRQSGGPVPNETTVNGATEVFGCCQWLRIRFDTPEAPFHRGDANDDGLLNIADPVFVLTVLFLGTEIFGCRDAADFDDDGAVHISDAIGALNFLFIGGPPPAPPGPPEQPCGVDPEPHTRDGCIRYASC